MKECYNNMYGAGCTETCGQCRDSKPCHHINGSCVDGCAPGFKGTLCVEGKISFPISSISIFKKCNFLYILQNAISGIMELDVFKNAVPFAKRHVTVTM